MQIPLHGIIRILNKNFMRLLTLFFILFIGTNIFSQSNDCGEWQLKTDESNYKVYSRACKNSAIKEFKVLASFTGDFKRISALFNDVETNKKLSESCVEARLLEKMDDNTHTEYVRYKTPIGIRERDIISKVVINATESSFALTSIAVSDTSVPKKKGVIRLTNAHTSFLFKKTSDGNIEMEYIAFADPSGFDPPFLVNSLTKKEARTLVEKLKVLVQP